MYSGFVTSRFTINAIGVHQRFDRAAFELIGPYLAAQQFPTLKQVQYFEGYNGPDGLKLKSPGVDEPAQLYDPDADRGQVPHYVNLHYTRLVQALRDNDIIRSAFEASWLAHFITDGLTPAHHFPLHDKLDELKGSGRPDSFLGKGLHRDKSLLKTVKSNWAMWGGKGLLSTHLNFEMGVAFALGIGRIRVLFNEKRLAHARRVGPVAFFKEESRAIASLKLYDRFYKTGWTSDLARAVKHELAPRTAEAIGYIWLLAYLEAGAELAMATRAT